MTKPTDPDPKGLAALALKLKDKIFLNRFWRAYNRYTNIRSNLLAGGIAYTALFSLAGIVTLLIMSVRVALYALPVEANSLYEAINLWLPGAIKVNGESGVVDPAAIASPGFSWGTAVVFAVSFVAGLRVVSALRVTVQEAFGLPQRAWALWKEPLRDFLMFFVLGLGMLLSLVVSAGSVVALQTFRDSIPFEVPLPTWLINGIALILTSFVTAGLTVLILRYLALVRAPRRDVWLGAGLFAVVTSGLQMFGTFLATNLSPLVAPFAVLFTLVLWVNLLARLFLYTCCWIANPPLAPAPETDAPHFEESPNYVTLSSPHTLKWPHDPITGQTWSLGQENLAKTEARKIVGTPAKAGDSEKTEEAKDSENSKSSQNSKAEENHEDNDH